MVLWIFPEFCACWQNGQVCLFRFVPLLVCFTNVAVLRSAGEDAFLEQQNINRAVQTVFLNYFLSLLKDYELYLLELSHDSLEEWLRERESVQSFDKVTEVHFCFFYVLAQVSLALP